jgi:hypothetical protein
MRTRLLGRHVSITLALMAALALLGACGGGGTTTTQGYYLQAIGPAGGVAQAGDVHLTIPPGALLLPTGVGILPEPGGFPIVPLVPDGCLHFYLGPIWCCGPVGQPLLVDGALRLSYDEALIPFGLSESDLELLIWDNIAGVMRPVSGPGVTHDTLNNVFLFDYPELGHLAVGVRVCSSNPQILLQEGFGGFGQSFKPGEGSTLGRVAPTLWLIDADGVQAPAIVPTDDVDEPLEFDEFLASPGGERVLLRVNRFDGKGSETSLWTVPLGTAGDAELIAENDYDTPRFLQGYDPLFGWLAAAPTEVFYVTDMPLASPAGKEPEATNLLELWRRAGDAGTDAQLMYGRSVATTYLDDLRQSPAQSPLLLRYVDYVFGDAVDVVLPSPLGGAPLSDDEIPSNPQLPSPQFFHVNEHLHYIADDEQVDVWSLADATVIQTHVLTNPDLFPFTLRSFAVAPDGEHWAAVIDSDFFDLRTATQIDMTELWMGTFTDGTLAVFEFPGFFGVNELVWHPNGGGVFLDLFQYGTGFYVLEDGDGFTIDERPLPVPGMNYVDVNRTDGRVLILVPEDQFQFELRTAGGLEPGLYVGTAQATDFAPVLLPDILPQVQARWVASWRLQPGMFTSRVR